MELTPVQSMSVTWREPVAQAAVFETVSDGWNALYALRYAEDLGADFYYQALLNPDGCCNLDEFYFNGVGAIPGDGKSGWDMRNRSAMIMVQESVAVSADTIVHELGHNQGLWHAPCGVVDNVDGLFPYASAQIGVQGYGILTDVLYSSTDAHMIYDLMSYCYPNWYSDYNWRRIFARVRTLSTWDNSLAKPMELVKILYASVSNGTVVWRLSDGYTTSAAKQEFDTSTSIATAEGIVGVELLPIMETRMSEDVMRDFTILLPNDFDTRLDTIKLEVDGETYTVEISSLVP